MTHNASTGRIGEDFAAAWLEQKGYEILYRNWRHQHWEIDIIAVKKNVLHFIEVKTRASRTFGYPEDNVSKKKIAYLIDAGEEFLFKYPHWQRIQFDILAITINPGKAKSEYFFIEDIYL
ncbi:MAG: YraN family protein [Ferruginibacter sp.]